MLEFVKTEPGDDPIIVECFFAASTASVFQAWTDPKIIMQWFGPRPNTLVSSSIDLRVGGRYRFVKSSDDEKATGFEGEYLVIETNERLVFTWAQFASFADGREELTPHSKVEIKLTPKGRGTDLRLRHSALHTDDARKDFAGGWERAFGNLVPLLANATDG
jgi:uncharacterized protein YndB with AHSA1/START domain